MIWEDVIIVSKIAIKSWNGIDNYFYILIKWMGLCIRSKNLQWNSFRKYRESEEREEFSERSNNNNNNIIMVRDARG